MVALSLKICVRHCNVVKTMQFEPSTAVYDACRVIRERVPEAQTGQGEALHGVGASGLMFPPGTLEAGHAWLPL